MKNKKAKKTSAKKAKPTHSDNDKILRKQLIELLAWDGAHANWEAALKDFPADKRGVRPQGSPHSAWDLLEHTRLAQNDILDFCVNAKYKAKNWPADYWPKTPAPPEAAAWEKTVRDFEKETRAMAKLVEDPKSDLYGKIGHGSGKTLLREALLTADHNAYHLGQFMLVRRMLGAWNEK